MNTRQTGKLARWFLSTSLLLAVVIILVGSAAPVVWAASFEVTNLNDSGAGSLRQAILAANEALGADTITFSPSNSGTITLNSTLPAISDPAGLTIDGGRVITISGDNQVRVMIVNSGAALTVKDLTIAGGNASYDASIPDNAYMGSGIYNQGMLTISNSTFSNNNAVMAGGGIYNKSGNLTIIETSFSGNSATSGGGGIYNYAGTLTVTGSNFSSNSAALEFPGNGGGIYNDAGMLTVIGSTFSANSAYLGGGIVNLGTMTVSTSTFSTNSAYLGGGIYNKGPLTVSTSTFSNNYTLVESLSNFHYPGSGGGIYNENGTLTITGSTFSANNSLNAGGGIVNNAGTLTIMGSTFTENKSTYPGSGAGIYNKAGVLAVTGSKFIDNSAYTGGGISASSGGTLEVSDSIFSSNKASGGAGGGIYNSFGASLTVTDSTFSSNIAPGGGGIYTMQASLTVTRSTFAANSSTSPYMGGGGIHHNSDVIVVTDSVFSGNSTTGEGGAINLGSWAEVRDSTFYANSARNGGGGIYTNSGTLDVTNSTFSANSTATWGGGGIFNHLGTLTISNSTFAGNNASTLNSSGGGVYNNGGRVTVTHGTFTDNSATAPGNGGSFFNYQGTITLSNTIIAHSPSGLNCSGTINSPMTDRGYNIEDGTSCNFSAANHSYPGTDPLLDPDGLKDNGGPTQTIALQTGSPAIDALPNGANSCGIAIITDQRGVTRPKGSGCDIGAYELENQPPVVSAGGPYTVDEGASVLVTASGNDPEGGPLIYAWDLDQDGSYETSGQNATFSAVGLDGPGSAAITAQVTDNGNLAAASQAMVSILNVAPTASFINASAVLIIGQSAWLAFSNPVDPSMADTADGFLYSYDCTSDGVFEATDSGGAPYACAYPDSGVFIAMGRIQDKDGGFTDYTVEVTVLTPQQATQDLTDQVYKLLAEGALNQGQGNALIAKLEAAIKQLDRGNHQVTINQLQAFINQVEAMISSGILWPDEGQPLIDAANEIITVLLSYP